MIKIGKWNIKESAIIGVSDIEKYKPETIEIPDDFDIDRLLKESPFFFEVAIKEIGIVKIAITSKESVRKEHAEYIKIINKRED